MRLGGWVRLSLAASVLWLLLGSAWQYHTLKNWWYYRLGDNHHWCEQQKYAGTQPQNADCWFVAEKTVLDLPPFEELLTDRLVYKVATPLAVFFFALGVAIFIYRWVRAGFTSG